MGVAGVAGQMGLAELADVTLVQVVPEAGIGGEEKVLEVVLEVW
jgi:hypothetical protein